MVPLNVQRYSFISGNINIQYITFIKIILEIPKNSDYLFLTRLSHIFLMVIKPSMMEETLETYNKRHLGEKAYSVI